MLACQNEIQISCWTSSWWHASQRGLARRLKCDHVSVRQDLEVLRGPRPDICVCVCVYGSLSVCLCWGGEGGSVV